MEGTRGGAGRGALFLTGMAALSQALSFAYRVALSRAAGAQVMGLYQLLMPAYSVLLSLTAVGLTAACANLTARYLAFDDRRGVEGLRRACLALLFGGVGLLALIVVPLSDPISAGLLGDARTQLGLVLLLPCAALTGTENIQKNIFYSAGLVRPPAFAELAEQLIRAAAVLGLLAILLPQNPERTLGAVVAGMILCEITSAATMTVLYHRYFGKDRRRGPGERAGLLLRRVGGVALPVGATALLGNLMGAANAALIPRQLVAGGMTREAAVARLGVVCGMTLPMLTLPTVFLGALNLVTVPALSRACALGRGDRVRVLTEQALRVTSVLILPSMALMAVLGPDLAVLLFGEAEAGGYLLPLGVATALGSFHSVLGGVLNGVSRQGETALISLVCDGVQLAFVFAVSLPGVGMDAFVAGTVISSALGAAACAWRAGRWTGLRLPLFQCVTAPGLACALSALTGRLLLQYLKDAGLGVLAAGAVTLVYALVLYLAALQAQGVSLRETFRLDPEDP